MTPAELAGWVERSRREQGYPFHVEDPVVLARIATLAFAGEEGGGDDRAA
jgi:hypothetical protein